MGNRLKKMMGIKEIHPDAGRWLDPKSPKNYIEYDDSKDQTVLPVEDNSKRYRDLMNKLIERERSQNPNRQEIIQQQKQEDLEYNEMKKSLDSNEGFEQPVTDQQFLKLRKMMR